jgi:hypothetical protein
MFCPRCGEEVEKGARYCSKCGATMPTSAERPKRKRSLRERLAGLIGRTRRERLITGGTVLAIVIAIAAFFALDSGEDGEEDSLALPLADTQLVDDACVNAKAGIANAANSAVRRGGGVEAYSVAVLRAIAEFRSTVRSLVRSPGVARLDQVLLDAEIDAGALARVAREQPDQLIERAEELDADTAAIEATIAEVGLARCGDLQLTLAPPS